MIHRSSRVRAALAALLAFGCATATAQEPAPIGVQAAAPAPAMAQAPAPAAPPRARRLTVVGINDTHGALLETKPAGWMRQFTGDNGLALPAGPITIIDRSAGSGSKAAFNEYFLHNPGTSAAGGVLVGGRRRLSGEDQ